MAIDQLSANDLLCKSILEKLNRQVRREISKKIGLATSTGSSLIAPTAVRRHLLGKGNELRGLLPRTALPGSVGRSSHTARQVL